MFVLTAYNELPVITRKTSWPLKLVITDFYCTIIPTCNIINLKDVQYCLKVRKLLNSLNKKEKQENTNVDYNII